MRAGIIIDGKLAIPFVAPLNITSNTPSFASDAVNLKRMTASQKAQRWEITTNLMPSNDSAEFMIHSVTNGHTEIFDVLMPQIMRFDQTTATVVKTLNATNPVARNSIEVTKNGNIAKGEFVKFTNHDKVYMIKAVTATRIEIFPSLVSSVPPLTEILTGDDVLMKARYNTDTMLGIKFVDGIMSDPGTVTLVEAL